MAAFVTDPFYQEAQLPLWLGYIAITFLLAGVAIIIFGVLNLNDSMIEKTPPFKNPDSFFRGIYKYVRHPIYAGMFIVLLAIALYNGSWFKGVITLFLGISFYFKSALEERKLIQQYRLYQRYKDQTGRFFPKFRHLRSR